MADLYSEHLTQDLFVLRHEEQWVKEEVAEVANCRRRFELLLRNAGTKAEFIQYIRYEEWLLDQRWERYCKLPREEKKERGNKKRFKSHILKPILILFERVFKRYWDDLSIWQTYFDMCARMHTKPALMKRAVELHSMNEDLWLYLAALETESAPSRALLQRGLRLISSQRLWLEYFKLELREYCLFKQESLISGSKVETPLLMGDTLRLAYDSAVDAFPDDLHFRSGFLEVMKGRAGLRNVRDHIIETTQALFGASERYWGLRAAWCVDELLAASTQPSLVETLRAVRSGVDVLENAVQTIETEAMWTEYVLFWQHRVDDLVGESEADQSLLCRYAHSLMKVCSRAHTKRLASSHTFQVEFLLLPNPKTTKSM